jgi:sterol desaturase/sphingolipid hydroxylase (fatty acid hydroxylase superfamily)
MTDAAGIDSWLPAAKPVVATVLLIALWSLEAVLPAFTGRKRRVGHAAHNLSLGLLNAVVAAVLFGGALLAVTEWSRQHAVGLLHWLDWPGWIEWPLALILFDLWMYTWHVINHKVPVLWRFHAVHHADRELDATSAVRFHTGEIFLSSIARLAVLPLLGMTMPQLLVYEAVLLPVILFHHSNVNIPPQLDAALRTVIPTPWMHWVHHSRLQPETDSNYGSVLSVWDRIFRTFRLREDPREITLGLDDDAEEKHWRTLPGMLLRPFRSAQRERLPRKKP